MINHLLISWFGLVIGRRIVEYLDQNQIFEMKTTFHLWILTSGALVLIDLSGLANFFVWCFDLGILASLVVISACQQTLRRRAFRVDAIHVLDCVVLSMQSGIGLKESLYLAAQSLKKSRAQILEILSLLQFQANPQKVENDLFFQRLSREIIEAHQSGSRTVEKIKSFRDNLKLEQDFRRKMSMVLAQIRAQAVVLAALYFGLVVFVVNTHGLEAVLGYLTISVGLFIFGLILLFLIPRGFRWKI